jgi:hypothetical protein
MSLTTTLEKLDMPENRASGNRRIRDWSSKVSRIHMTLSGRLRPFMCAQSKLTEIGEITYYNQSTKEVAQRGLRERSQCSNEDERENDALSRAF